MASFPEDIFTEPVDVDPDTLANLGPLKRLAGTWESAGGHDINPKADGPEHRDYIERILFDPIDPQANGPQLFYGLRYHTHINTPEEDITFHDQVGYWLWEPTSGLVLQTIAIPRGQIAIAAGRADPNANKLVLTAERGQTEYGICSTAFLEYAFRTDRYEIELTFNPDGTFSYVIDTTLTVRGQAGSFSHRDENRLTKIKDADPNPLMQILGREARSATGCLMSATGGLRPLTHCYAHSRQWHEANPTLLHWDFIAHAAFVLRGPHFERAVSALKTARIVWAVLARGEVYRAPVVAA